MFCDSRDVAEDLRAPVADIVLESFVSKLAGIYSASAISNYVAAIRAWHIVHGINWAVEGPQLDAIIKGAKHMAPQALTRQLREPITVNYIEEVYSHLSDTDPLDVAVFACLTTAFWSTARLGEFTIKNLTAFDPKPHVKRADVGKDTDRRGFKTTTFRIPETKANRTEGEMLYWAKQEGASDPESALKRHPDLNNPDNGFHLFRYHNKQGKMVPMTKSTFTKRLSDAALAAGLPRMKGHSIRIGSTLEYLLRGLPFEVMKAKGRWNSDAFHRYLREHAIVLAPYMQAAPPVINDQFVHIAIPSAR